jgi:hypothetical protein
MHVSDSQSIQTLSSKKSPYGLSDNEKVLIAITRWDTYANMKVSYGMNVFEYEHAENQRILKNKTDESEAHQAQGDSRKKFRREEDRRTMQFGVFSGVHADGDYGFTDEETTEVKNKICHILFPKEVIKDKDSSF